MENQKITQEDLSGLKVNLYQAFKPVFEHVDKNIESYNALLDEECKLHDKDLPIEEVKTALRQIRGFFMLSREELTLLIVNKDNVEMSEDYAKIVELTKELVNVSVSQKLKAVSI